ncbi:MAG: hypothetical protein N2645_08850 [Clostridia bacterium]|nr:hypothetical protein [Clostridia bacterium]
MIDWIKKNVLVNIKDTIGFMIIFIIINVLFDVISGRDIDVKNIAIFTIMGGFFYTLIINRSKKNKKK